MSPAQISRRSLLGWGSLAAIGGSVAGPGVASAAPNFPDPGKDTPLAAIRSYGDMVDQLRKLEGSSRYPVTVRTLSEIGTAESLTEQGRELYVATVGTGDTPVWVQGRIHGNEPYGLDSSLTVLKRLATSGAKEWRAIREEFTVHVIPCYNPDSSEGNIRQTILWDREADAPRLDADGNEQLVDLNRDWAPDAFVARESLAWYEYWTMVKPAYALDIHHQGLKTDRETGEAITFSLGISLAPGGPTLPGIEGGEYDVVTRQMQGHVWLETLNRGFISTDKYDVGYGTVIDIRGGVVSAMMLGLDYNGLNPTGHSNPAVFFETSGNTRDGNIGHKAHGKMVKQNVLGLTAWLDGLATGEVFDVDPQIWDDEIPGTPVLQYFTDWGGIIPA
ncbi:Tat (twin-arginine translocation) pathway signal sequence [Serinicoccus sp. CNJ-927]|uniref:M14 family zinc carboxypeptidase n=1 Tax=Serinicoccus sp. CNJ-927 TaxID=1904970 RepID=UPI000967C400|nr:M14 family zinc carboxypeptidase [Serinicoccus sp. CNJ-927]OLT44631.1 Tat (twin-arginine translocation) pathway signal sequence [Serinicoccus sp. CNJ-927]